MADCDNGQVTGNIQHTETKQTTLLKKLNSAEQLLQDINQYAQPQKGKLYIFD